MSSIPCTTENENEISGFVSIFMKEFQVGKLLFQCNAGTLKGIPVMDIFRYLFCLMFSDRSMYIQRKLAYSRPASVRIPFIGFLIMPRPTGSVLLLYCLPEL